VSGQRHDVGWRINGANDVTVLWRGRKRGELQTAMGQKDTARRITERSNGGFDIFSGNPPIAVLPLPGGPGKRHQRNAGTFAGAGRMFRNARGERMGGIDHGIDSIREKKVAESIDPTKTTDAEWNRRLPRAFGTARKGKYGGDVSATCQALRQQACLSGASEDKNAHHVAPQAVRR
jgi:hypothetical protein